MATARQREAARRNLEKARKVQSERARDAKIAPGPGMSTAEKDRLRTSPLQRSAKSRSSGRVMSAMRSRASEH
jgi:hypothetical protein